MCDGLCGISAFIFGHLTVRSLPEVSRPIWLAKSPPMIMSHWPREPLLTLNWWVTIVVSDSSLNLKFKLTFLLVLKLPAVVSHTVLLVLHMGWSAMHFSETKELLLPGSTDVFNVFVLHLILFLCSCLVNTLTKSVGAESTSFSFCLLWLWPTDSHDLPAREKLSLMHSSKLLNLFLTWPVNQVDESSE